MDLINGWLTWLKDSLPTEPSGADPVVPYLVFGGLVCALIVFIAYNVIRDIRYHSKAAALAKAAVQLSYSQVNAMGDDELLAYHDAVQFVRAYKGGILAEDPALAVAWSRISSESGRRMEAMRDQLDQLAKETERLKKAEKERRARKKLGL